jgi:hypothetical protein
MTVFNKQQIEEINEHIAKIEKVVKPKCEIGGHDKALLSALLRAQTPKTEATFFTCRREFSDAIISHFVKEKGVAKSRYHKNEQAYIFVTK